MNVLKCSPYSCADTTVLDNEELSTAWPKQAENLKNILHSKGVLKDEQFADG